MSRVAKTDKLRALREARAAKSSLLSNSDAEGADQEGIYDEVDEDTYREHKRHQLINDDFIVDDDGEGYVDNGADEWDDRTRPNYYSEDEDDGEASNGKKRKKAKSVMKVKKTSQINNFFKPSGFNVEQPTKKKNNANVDDILEDFFDSAVVPPVKKQKKHSDHSKLFGGNNVNNQKKDKKSVKASNFNFSSSARREKKVTTVDDDEDFSMDLNEQQPSSPIKVKQKDDQNSDKENIDDQAVEVTDVVESKIEITGNDKQEGDDDEDDIDDSSDDDIIITRRPRASASNVNKKTNFSAVKSTNIPSSSPSRQTAHAAVSYTEKLDEATIVGKDTESNSFKMFWLDYCEVDNSLLLFGKIQTVEGNLVSGVVQINGLYRELYFLPRKHRVVNDEETDEEISSQDVHEEVIPLLLETYQLQNIRAKPETKKYAFELPGIPSEAEYLKVLLPYKTPKNPKLILPSDLEGETFSHVFGTNANIFETFVTQRNIMGPCWLEISKGDFNAIVNTSHSQVEAAIPSPSCVKPITDTKILPPPLNVTSIAVQTIMSTKSNKQEVVSVSLATYRDLPQDAPLDESLKPDDQITLVRPVGSVSVPPGLAQLAQKQGLALRVMPNEKALLNCLAALVKNLDPDVFVGHRLENISLDVLVHRMYDLKVSTWSTFGRRNRKAWPEKFGKSSGNGSNGFNNSLHIREIFQGRLLCDIANEMGQSLTSKCQSWDLPEMYEVVCHTKQTALEINFQNPRYAEDASFLLLALSENFNNVLITAEIAFSIQILSLSKQLTNLAGNAWSHTLSGTRAGRNEYILLHEFKRQDYIVPDKENKYHKNANNQQQAKLESTEEDATTATSNKKPKFQGGLVFEPEKGLHKNYTLVMDFNSLYPSIIQEFNICFTTVDRHQFNLTHDEDRDMPILPDSDSSQGVLPRLLNTLVSRRREVKKLLKDPKNTPAEKVQFDIKQQALKLTANSMYGCLGYVNSRFYAKPLAMMVTNKGREILMDTRQLAESIGLRVIYGDTDSVMIDTGVSDYWESIKIGEDFKVQVNERYKLLEIDIDNIFKRLLLHAKKKYAALNATINRKTGEEQTVLEVKGLDMRRREYCQVSKDISTFVLKKILSDVDPEIALGEVYEYLEDMTKKIKDNAIAVDSFKINTKLSKDPNNYPNGKTMPAVKVALRLREQGKVIKAGSVITYIITAPNADDLEDENSSISSPAERARAIQEVLSKNSNLRPDPMFYLEKQIFAPVERLVERIEGVDMMRIASSLGMDSRKFAMRMRSNAESGGNGEILPLESNISDIERFNQCSFLVLQCTCGSKFRFGGILASNSYRITFNGINCAKCGFTFPILRINSQLEYTIRKHIALYYAGWLVCDDSACGITTRQISVYGKRCIGASGKAFGCKGIMRYKYSDRALYNQLLYFQSIFDVDKAKGNKLRPIYDVLDQKRDSEPPKIVAGQVDALAEQNRELFNGCQEVVQKYLGECGRRYVDMGSIFDFMK
ncbi:DNA polymerase alpha catalytic subunit A [[Candida] railenensis]|uniref:DNA polymerase n=1 Tax=[Candida] railenensis TaxID=45579 RepID=A0A9P0VXR4_9ASCO|nr:DNA polymerase alpha catalytic subunit A [[Candida] railenensis]